LSRSARVLESICPQRRHEAAGQDRVGIRHLARLLLLVGHAARRRHRVLGALLLLVHRRREAGIDRGQLPDALDVAVPRLVLTLDGRLARRRE
jgi:hypothetical protein